MPRLLPIAIVAIGAATRATQLVLFGLGIFPFEPVAIVPLAGMVVGNSLAATVSAARRVVAELADHRLEVEARWRSAGRRAEAGRPYVRAAVRTALTTQIESHQDRRAHRLPGGRTGSSSPASIPSMPCSSRSW